MELDELPGVDMAGHTVHRPDAPMDGERKADEAEGTEATLQPKHIISNYITLHYITLHYIALHCITLHCIV